MSRLLAAQRAFLVPAWGRDLLYRRAGAVPSLDIWPAVNKTLADITTGRNLVTFTRASSATYIDSDGAMKVAAVDVPRIDHDPVTGECLGLLIEEQRTNLNTNSEAFDTYGTSAGSVSANQGVAPNGTSTADEITSTGGGAYKSISGTTTSTAYTVSVFAKYISGGGIFSFGFDANPSSGRADFNLQTGALGGTVGANVTSRSITPYGNGWYRCSVTATVTSTSTIVVFYNSTSGEKWLCWGAQLEAGAFPTSYIPTTSSAATRAADVASITGANFSNWYNQNEGTLYTSSLMFGIPSSGTDFRRIISLCGTDVNTDEISIYRRSSDGMTGGSVTVSPQIITFDSGFLSAAINTPFKAAIGYKTNDTTFAFNGAVAATDASVVLPTVVSLQIGQSVRYQPMPNAIIRRLTYWPRRLPNSILQTLTR